MFQVHCHRSRSIIIDCGNELRIWHSAHRAGDNDFGATKEIPLMGLYYETEYCLGRRGGRFAGGTLVSEPIWQSPSIFSSS